MATLTPTDPPEVPAPVGGYTQTLKVAGVAELVYVSGQIPVRPSGTIPGSFDEQCRLAWSNVVSGLRANGLGIERLAKVTTYLTDRADAPANRIIRREFLGDHRPASTVVVVQTLDPRWLLEIEATAAR